MSRNRAISLRRARACRQRCQTRRALQRSSIQCWTLGRRREPSDLSLIVNRRHERRQHNARCAAQRVVRMRGERRLAGVDFDDSGAGLSGICRQRSRWIDLCRGTDDQQHFALPRSLLCRRKRILGEHFLEPHDIGTQRCAAACAKRHVIGWLPMCDDGAFSRALHAIAYDSRHVDAGHRRSA